MFAVAAGACVVVALPPYSILPLALVPFAALALLLRDGSQMQAIGLGYLFGLGQFVPGLFWISESFQVEANRFGWLALPAVVGLAAVLSIFPALACGVSARLARAGLPPALSLATTWTFAEWLRGHVLTGFPWNLAAYTLADWTILAQGASVFGSYGLGFLMVLCAACTGLAVGRVPMKLRRTRIGVAVAIVLGLAGFGALRIQLSAADSSAGPEIRIVQPNIAQSAKWDPAARDANILRLLRLSARPGTFDLLLWPETAWPGFLTKDAAARAMVGWLLSDRAVLLTGSPEREVAGSDTIYRNAVLAIGPDGTVLTRYAKHHLVPFGEYVPWRSLLPFQRIVRSLGDFTPGPGPRTLAFGPFPFPGVAICYEVIFPGHVVDEAIRPDWIFNATNDAWFGTSIGPWQHFASARMRAVEEGLPLVRAANTGISAVVDPFGRVTALLDLGEQGIIDTSLPRPLRATPYALFGDWMLLALLAGFWTVSAICQRVRPAKLLTGNTR
ncbi:MAG: apolipoprotein N-acyltransferase [Gemmobacter sp.]